MVRGAERKYETRCDVVQSTPDGAMRCILWRNHARKQTYGLAPTACQFSSEGDQEVCFRRQTNFSTRRTRFCAMTLGHQGDCIFADETERDATREDMRLPPLPPSNVTTS